MKVTRIKENSQLLNMVADMLQSGLISNTPEAMAYVVTILSDISKSLAIIADTMSEAVGDNPLHPFADDVMMGGAE